MVVVFLPFGGEEAVVIFGGCDIRGGGGGAGRNGDIYFVFCIVDLTRMRTSEGLSSEWIVQDIRRKDRRIPYEGFGWQNLPVC